MPHYLQVQRTKSVKNLVEAYAKIASIYSRKHPKIMGEVVKYAWDENNIKPPFRQARLGDYENNGKFISVSVNETLKKEISKYCKKQENRNQSDFIVHILLRFLELNNIDIRDGIPNIEKENIKIDIFSAL